MVILYFSKNRTKLLHLKTIVTYSLITLGSEAFISRSYTFVHRDSTADQIYQIYQRSDPTGRWHKIKGHGVSAFEV